MPPFNLSFALILVCCLAFSGAGCKRKQAEQPSAEPAKSSVLILGEQDVARVTLQNMLAGIRFAGTLDPALRVDVKAQTSGQLTELLTDRGTTVTQHQALATLDDPAAKAQVESIKGQVAAAERDFNSYELLFKAGAASERTYANAKVTWANSKAQLVQAEQAVARATIRSPIAGIVSERVTGPGDVISPGQRLFSVVNISNLVCDSSVLPVDAGSVRKEQRAVLTLSGFGEKLVDGFVERIDPVADPKTRRVGVHIRVPNPEGKLVAGLFATGVILTNQSSTVTAALLVPAAAIREQNGKQFADIVQGDRIARRPIETSMAAEAGFATVRSGLKEGDLVVLLPAGDVKDGAKVQLVKPPK